MRTPAVCAVSLCALAGLAPAALAQPAGDAPEGTAFEAELDRTRSQSRLGVSVSGDSEYSFASDLDGSGDFSVARLGAGVAVSGVIDRRNRLIFSFDNEFSFYDLSGTSLIALRSDDLLEETYDSRFGVTWLSQIDEAWSLLLNGNVTASGEPGADFGDSLTGGGLLVVSNQITPSLRIGGGLLARTRLEDNALVIPIVAVDWLVTDSVTVTTSGQSGGAGLEVRYELNDEVTLTLSGGWRSDDYRLEDGNPVPDGVVRHDRVPVALGVVYRPTPTIELVATAGAHVYQRLEVLSGGGTELADADGDPSAFATFGVSFRF